MARSGEHKKGGVRATPPSLEYAGRRGLRLEVCRLRSGGGYLEVYRGERLLGSLWHYTADAPSRWRVYPQGLPARSRCYARTQYNALVALVLAHENCRPVEKEPSAMWSAHAKVQDLVRHITLVRNACCLLGTRLIDRGEVKEGVELYERGHRHDASKWRGLEWDVLHSGPETDEKLLELAMRQHTANNDHHPEFWPDGIHGMSRLAMAEMVCDWYARSQEKATGLRQWITEKAMGRFGFKPDDDAHKRVMEFVALLVVDTFVKTKG